MVASWTDVDRKWTACGPSVDVVLMPVDLTWTCRGPRVDEPWTRARHWVAERVLRTGSAALEPSLPLERCAAGTCWTLEGAEVRLPSLKSLRVQDRLRR